MATYSMHKLLQEAVDRVKRHIFNQVRYIYPTHRRSTLKDTLRMEVGSDKLTDDDAAEMLQGKCIISNRTLLRLIGNIGLEELYDEDAWLDTTADHILTHKKDCKELWDRIWQLGGEDC